MFCIECGEPIEIENSEPVTVSGWYGNTRFVWDFVNGVKTVIAKEIKCKCGKKQVYEERE